MDYIICRTRTRSEVLLFTSISRETTERECWWVQWGCEETCGGDEELVGHMPYLAVWALTKILRLKSTTVQKSCPFTNYMKREVALTALKVHIESEVHHRKTELNHWTRVWLWAVRVGLFGIGDAMGWHWGWTLDFRYETRCVSNSCRNFAIADDEQTQSDDSA